MISQSQRYRSHKFLFQTFLLLFFSVLSAFSIASESIAIKGVVKSKIDGLPVPYARVKAEGVKTFETLANEEGVFTFNLPDGENYAVKSVISGELSGESESVLIDSKRPPELLILEIELSGESESLLVIADSTKKQFSNIRIEADVLERVAGTGGDPIWAVQTLPGVAIGEDVESEPAVRGSFPGDNLYYVDFLPVGYLFHLGDSISVLPGDLVQAIDFFPSAFGPEYGDKLGGVFDIQTVYPNTESWKRKVDISLLGLSLNAQGPMNDRQSAFLALRKSYLDVALDAMEYNESHDEDLAEVPSYVDYQGKYAWQLDNNDHLTFLLNGATGSTEFDRFPQGTPWIVDEKGAYHSQGVIWDRQIGGNSNRFAMSYLLHTSSETDGTVEKTDLDTKSIMIRDQFQYKLNEQHWLLLGGDFNTESYSYYNWFQYFCGEPTLCETEVDLHERINAGAFYVKDQWQVKKPLLLSIGARLSGNDLVKTFHLEPRLGMEYQFSAKSAFHAAWGKYNQTPSVPQLIGNFGNPALEHRRSEHSLLGYTQHFTDGWFIKSEVYYKALSNGIEEKLNERVRVNTGTGEAYGLELLIKKSLTRRFSGWLSLSMSQTRINNHQINQSFYTNYDQPVIASFVFNAKLKKQWFFDLRWYFHSGRPYTPVLSASPQRNEETDEIIRYNPMYGEFNSVRYPDYHRLDVRISKKADYPGWEFEWYFGIINLYDRDNVEEYNYNTDYSQKIPSFQLPIFPTFGIKAEF